MEPAGLAVGVIGLAGLFNNAIDCFKYVQLGRNFGVDFQTNLIKLDIARLRLSRWGRSIGLSGDVQDARSLQNTLRAENVKKAEGVLGHILDLFAHAERIAREFEGKAGPNDPGLQICDLQRDLGPTAKSLHEKMRDLSLRRQNRTRLRYKAKWALYKEEDFKKLIVEISNLTNDLIELFPAATHTRKKICQAELSEISQAASYNGLGLLRGSAAGQDEDLEAMILDVIARRVSHASQKKKKKKRS